MKRNPAIPKFRALIELAASARETPFNGDHYRPNVLVEGFSGCLLIWFDEWIYDGNQTGRATVAFLVDDAPHHALLPGVEIDLCEGGRVTGYAQIVCEAWTDEKRDLALTDGLLNGKQLLEAAAEVDRLTTRLAQHECPWCLTRYDVDPLENCPEKTHLQNPLVATRAWHRGQELLPLPRDVEISNKGCRNYYVDPTSLVALLSSDAEKVARRAQSKNCNCPAGACWYEDARAAQKAGKPIPSPKAWEREQGEGAAITKALGGVEE